MSFISIPITIQSLFGTQRVIGPYNVQLLVNEETTDTLTITKQPVQNGASITDHAYMEPSVLSMNILQQNTNPLTQLQQTFNGGGLAEIYAQFLALQSDRTPFSITTPKRVYKNMLLATLRMSTDKTTENILSLGLSFQEVIIVSVGTVQIPKSRQRKAPKTQATQDTGQKSFLVQIEDAGTGLIGGGK